MILLELLEFIGLEIATTCNDVGLNSWAWTNLEMAFSLLEYTRLSPYFLSSGVGSAVLGSCSVTFSVPFSVLGTLVPMLLFLVQNLEA